MRTDRHCERRISDRFLGGGDGAPYPKPTFFYIRSEDVISMFLYNVQGWMKDL